MADFDARSSIVKRDLTPEQRRLLTSQLKHANAPVQNMATLTHIEGQVDAKKLAKAFSKVVSASDVLRSLVKNNSGQVMISPEETAITEIVEIGRSDVLAWAKDRVSSPLDMSVCAYDSAVALHEDGTVSWYLNLHHMITDATSSALVLTATAEAYEGKMPALVAYYDWAEEFYNEDAAKLRAKVHWDARNPAPKLDAFYSVDTRNAANAHQVALPINAKLAKLAEERLDAEYRMFSEPLAWSCLLLTTTAIFLHRISGGNSFSIGLPVHHRTDPETREVIGPTIEVYPVDVVIEPGDTYQQLHKRISGALFTTLKNAMPGTSPAGDYDAVVNIIPDIAASIRFGEFPASMNWLHSGAMDSGHAFRLHMSSYGNAKTKAGSRPSFALDVNDAVATPEHQKRIGAHFVSVLEAVLEKPDALVGAGSLCTAPELKVLEKWEAAAPFKGRTALVTARLKAVLSRNNSIVLEAGNEQLTGEQLWVWALNFAQGLTQSGISKGSRVGIGLAPSVEAVVAVFGTMLAGASFVPLDPTQPRARLTRLSQRAGLARVFSTAESVRAHQIDVDTAAIRRLEKGASTNAPKAGDEAYLLFTSGSTGEPKGVPITHQGLAWYLRFATESYFKRMKAPVAPLFGSLTFDLALTSLFAPMLAGGKLVVIGGGGAAAMASIAVNSEINWCKATPSHLEILTRLLPLEHKLKALVAGGEAFGSRLAEKLLAFNPSMEIFNEYGPTEAVVGCMIFKEDGKHKLAGSDVPIGRPAPGVTLRVVDQYGNRVPLGASGELWISHKGLTEGYLDENERAAGPFVTADGKRFYRSGDLVRMQSKDELVYLGRVDSQIKVGGIRLSPVEVEEALNRHPLVAQSTVDQWSPLHQAPRHHCVRCGLPDNVPGVKFDADGVCDTCQEYERVAPLVESWFKTPEDFVTKLKAGLTREHGEYDCLHLLSGGKDSTYVLYRLVDLGFKPFVLTLDNGFISESAKDNVRRVVRELGVDHEFATSGAMNAIFQDSLITHSNVCQGCFKAIYTLATNKAVELKIPTIVTGLSRGQLFETRLIPHQFSEDRFDPEAIDRAILNARKHYHRTDDGVNRLLDTHVFDNDALFEEVEYVDFYRYFDVELSEMLDYLAQKTPWLRPEDTGRSTNCLVNAAGIYTHLKEQGYHNYAIPYAWDVRLGHKQRQEAMDELNDDLDAEEIGDMLGQINYEPREQSILTAWIVLSEETDVSPTPTELRAFLSELLPKHAVPSSFVNVPEIPLTPNGKVDHRSLPAPERTHRSSTDIVLSAETETESKIVAVWERILKIEPIGVMDDFFALGGDSLGALEMIMQVSKELNIDIAEDSAFSQTTPKSLADVIDKMRDKGSVRSAVKEDAGPRTVQLAVGTAPQLSVGEQSILFDQRSRPDGLMYNVGRIFRVAGNVDAPEFESALRQVIPLHQPLSWSFSSPRRKLTVNQTLSFEAVKRPVSQAGLVKKMEQVHRTPFDLDKGPLMRCLVQPVSDGNTVVFFAIHHVSGDHESFDRLWGQINAVLDDRNLPDVGVDYSSFCQWQVLQHADADKSFWLSHPEPKPVQTVRADNLVAGEVDGFLTKRSTLRPEEFKQGNRFTPVATAVASAAASVAYLLGQGDIDLALVSSSRTHPSARELFGYLLNPLPLRINASGSTTFAALLEEASLEIGKALPHRGYPFAKMVADRKLAGLEPPSAHILVAYDDAIPSEMQGLTVTQGVAFNGTAVADLTFFVEVREETIDLSVEYSGKTIGKDLANDILGQFEQAVAIAVRSPSTPVRQLGQVEPTLAKGESVLIGDPLESNTLVLDQIMERFSDQPHADAVICGDGRLSWRELHVQSSVIASRLKASGVGKSDKVIVCLPRSTHLIAAILGVQLAGAAYVPVDPGYPDDWISRIINASNATLAIVSPGQELPVKRTVEISDAELGGVPWSDLSKTDLVQADLSVRPDDPVYVIFTSGSTGAPRGVAVTHGQLSASTNARRQFYDMQPKGFALLSSASFDSSVVGLFWTLATGGVLVLPTERQAHDVDALIPLLQLESVTHTLCVPTLYGGMLARAKMFDGWPSQIIVAGEACPGSLVSQHFSAVPECRLTNEYGPTEATVWVTAHHCDGTEVDVPIGKPVAGVWVAVVDGNGEVCLEGEGGELIVGGAGVTGGYINDAEQTQLRFGTCKDAESLKSKLEGPYFKTGDRAMIQDELVYFGGRMDDQLSLGGVRLEPSEVEAVLMHDDSVAAAIVTVCDTRPLTELLEQVPKDVIAQAMAEAGKSDDPELALLQALRKHGTADLRLVAHVEAGSRFDRDRLRAVAEKSLPKQSVPSVYINHAELPRTPNGKLDRAAAQALPTAEPASEVDGGRPASARLSEEGIVARLTEMFQKELRDPSYGAEDSFFEFGGHSLMVINLLLTIEKEFGEQLPTTALYDAPTPREFAKFISAAPGNDNKKSRSLVVPIQPKGSLPPLFALHNLGDDCVHFRPLSRELGLDQPIYGLGYPQQLNVFDIAEKDPTAPYDIRDIAASYVEQILRISPSGPIHLIGLCGGAVAAYEVAVQLAEKGRMADQLIMISDWHAPYLRLHSVPTWRAKLSLFAHQFKRHKFAYLVDLASRAPGIIARQYNVIKRQLEIRELKRMHRLGKPLSYRMQMRQYTEQAFVSLHHYEYGKYAGPVTIIRGDDDPSFPPLEETTGWGDLLNEPDFVTSSGHSTNMMQPPHVEPLAAHVRGALGLPES